MRYVTSFERLAKEEAKVELAREHILEVLQLRFSEVPQNMVERVESINALSILRLLSKSAVITDSLKNFQLLLQTEFTETSLEIEPFDGETEFIETV